MNVIDRHIRYLLRAHGSVAVPGLGVFVANRLSSAFDGDILVAPCIHISFTPDETCDSTSLVTSVARQLGISDIDADSLVRGEVEQWVHQLSLGVPVEIDGVGTLHTDTSDGTVNFTTSAQVADNWLQPLQLSPIKIAVEVYENTDAEQDEHRRRLKRAVARTASSAAAIAIMVLIAFIASQLPKTPSQSEVQYASLPIEPLSNLRITSDGSQVEHHDCTNHALVLILNTPSDGIAEPTPVRRVPEVSEDSRYCLVVASLYSRKEAETFIASTQTDVDLGILESDGRYRVFASQGPTIAAVKADAEVRKLYDRFPSGWICRK